MANEKMQLVSVVMSIYNEPVTYIDQAVNSILNQTYSNIEFIIIVDNPEYSEAIKYIYERIKEDSRIKLILNDSNIGLASSLNAGIGIAKGSFIARMDADDISFEKRLEEELKYLHINNLDVVACAVQKIDGQGNINGKIHPPVITPDEICKYLEYKNPIVHPTVIIKTDVIRVIGGYRKFDACQDYDLWTRLATSGYKIGQLDEVLLSFRRHEKSVTATRRFNQVVNEMYIQSLFHERKINGGIDSFSEKNLCAFRKSLGGDNKEIIERENRLLEKYKFGVQAVKQHHLAKGIKLILLSFRSKLVRYVLYSTIKARRLKK